MPTRMDMCLQLQQHSHPYSINRLETALTLWLFNIAMENGPFIDDFPSYKPLFIVDLYHGYVSDNQMVQRLGSRRAWNLMNMHWK